jgi:hypothetical protein
MLLLRLGLPITAFFVAFNPIWGFSWYFNTESWATGIYQKLTELRVDTWRATMIDAVTRTYGGGDELFRIEPAGVSGNGDFSFLVIGDPGEGDASQYSLASRYLKLGQNDDVKFLVVSSDVIYPAGAIEDYEAKFYLPFQGFTKPVYAIPGNHDWFDALEGFNANFLEPKAARAAIEARVDADLKLTSTNTGRIDRLMGYAERMRRLYAVNSGSQRAPFFELQTDDFALIAVDTGILRSLDDRQHGWLERALERSRGKFTIAIVGHPRFAGGHDIPPTAEGQNVSESSEKFAALYRLLASHNVNIAMAGDTHDFEYYRENITGNGPARVMHHFVNGGGGAYLSIGTALDFPDQPAAVDWSFYPRTDHLRAKMDAEMPLWKQPFWYWITAHPSSRASWKCGSNDRRSALSSSSTAFTVRCSGVTCRPVAQSSHPASHSMIRLNLLSRWTDYDRLMSAIGPQRTSLVASHMSAFDPKRTSRRLYAARELLCW